MEHSTSSMLSFGEFEFDHRAGTLRKAGRRLNLQRQPSRVLALLVATPGEVVTRDALRRQLWADDTFVDFDRGLNAAVNRLRDTLGDSAEVPRFIETVPRRGYRFVAPVSDATSRPPPVPPASQPAHSRRIPALVAITLLFACAVPGLTWLVRRTSSDSTTLDLQRTIVAARIDIPAGVETLLPVSPDGRKIALYQTSGPHGRTILIQPLDGGDPHWLPGAESALPRGWSPDGRSFAVTSGGLSSSSPSTRASSPSWHLFRTTGGTRAHRTGGGEAVSF